MYLWPCQSTITPILHKAQMQFKQHSLNTLVVKMDIVYKIQDVLLYLIKI
jgi:hypothetical protein